MKFTKVQAVYAEGVYQEEINADWYMRPVTAFDSDCEDLVEQQVCPTTVAHFARLTRDINIIKRAFPTMPEKFQQGLFDSKLMIVASPSEYSSSKYDLKEI